MRKPGRRAKEPEEITPKLDTDSGGYQSEDISVDIEDLLNVFGPESGIDFKTTLYRLVDTATKTKRTLVYSWENYIPDVNEIGTLAGAGRFDLYVRGIDKNNRPVFQKKAFTIDEIWDEIRESNKAKAEPLAGAAPGFVPAPNPVPAFDFEKIVSMVASITAAIKPLLDTRRTDPVDMLEKLSLMGTKLLETNFERSIAMQNKLLERTAETERENAGELNVRDIVEMIQPYLASIVAAPKRAIPAMVGPMKNQEMVRQIARNKLAVQALYAELCKAAGEEKANIVAKSLGIQIINKNNEQQEGQGASA